MTMFVVSLILGAAAGLPLQEAGAADDQKKTRPHVAIRGIYGGVPARLIAEGRTLADAGVNAVWIGSTQLDTEDIATLREQGARVFAEFNTMHHAAFLETNPDAAPIGPDGEVSPPPDGWQGICPTHPGYRRDRMEAFRDALAGFDIDGIWLDYHHAHASWERAEPILPDTCFCPRCLARFAAETGTTLPDGPIADVSASLLGPMREAWTQWRRGVFTDWVREFKQIRDAVRPEALLGTFHCPWTTEDLDGALREKLAIDLKAQAAYIDVFSTMPYHARFGHADDPAWISRQTAWLGAHLGIQGTPEDAHKIWPIVQLADWGESVPVEQVPAVLDHGTRLPATGVMVFHWNGLEGQPEKTKQMSRWYRAIAP